MKDMKDIQEMQALRDEMFDQFVTFEKLNHKFFDIKIRQGASKEEIKQKYVSMCAQSKLQYESFNKTYDLFVNEICKE